MVQGKISRNRHTAIRLGATPSGLTTVHLHHPPFFYRPDALHATQPTVSKHWRQEWSKATGGKRCVVVTVSDGGVQHSVCAGARQEAHCSLPQLCAQGQPHTRQVRRLEPVQTRRTDWSLWQLSAWQHREFSSCTFCFEYQLIVQIETAAVR